MQGHGRARATVRAAEVHLGCGGGRRGRSGWRLYPRGRPCSRETAATSAPNLLTGDQASFAGTTGGWAGSNAILTPGADSSSLRVTGTALAWAAAWSALPPSGRPTPATPGDKYTGDATVEESFLSPATVGDALVFFNSAGTVLNAVWGQAITPTASTWSTLPEVVAMAPASTAYVALVVISYSASLGQGFQIESPVLNVLKAPATAPSVVGPLSTSGNQIMQANGQPVTLRGLVMPGLEQKGTLAGTGVSEQAVVEAKDWGANFVRVPLGEQFWLSSNCDYVPGYVSTVDQVVKWITSLGMVALLDLHTNTVGGCQAGTEHNMADESQAPTFWSEVAQRYGNPTSPEYSPLVAFDLYNEPHNVSDAVWLNGGKTTDSVGGQTYQAAGMQQLYNSVRAGGVRKLGVHQRPQLGQHPSVDPRERLQHRVRGALLHVPQRRALDLHELQPLRRRPRPEPVGRALGHRARRGLRVRLALPAEWHLRPQRDRLRRLARVGLERLRLGGPTVSDGVGPDPPLAR